MTLTLTNFATQSWIITPTAPAVGESAPTSIYDQNFLLVLSGVVIANFQANTADWNRETLFFSPDMNAPLNWAINRFSIPVPTVPGGSAYPVFALEQWAPFASLSSIYDQNQSVNAGFAVDSWQPSTFETGTNVATNSDVGNVFTGIDVNAAASDTDAWIYRIGYNITLVGKIAFFALLNPS